MNAPAESALYLDFCRQIVKVRSRFRATHGINLEIPDDEVKERVAGKRPLFDPKDLKLDEHLLNEFLADLLPLLEKHEVFDRNQIKELKAPKGESYLGRLVQSILSKRLQDIKSMSAELQVETDILFFVGLNSAQMALELHAERLKDRVGQEDWLLGICPVCGSPPAIQRLKREEGRRMLRCSFCATEWYFKRIMCPFCGNEDQNSLRYFFIDESSPVEKPAFRVDVCDNCKSYIKTLDERKLPESEKPDLCLENLGTLYLDVLAQRDGYQSPTYWMIGPSEDLFV